MLDLTNLPKSAWTEFTSALNQICSERGISPQVVIETIKAALVAAYKKTIPLPKKLS